MIGKYTYTDDGVYPNTVTAIAADADGNTDTAAADASVEVTDTKPAITVTKTGDPTTVLETGGSVVFTYVVANTGTVPVTLTSLVDDKFGALAGDADCTIGDAEADPVVPATVLAAGASCTFQATFAIPAGAAGTTHEDVFTATAVDDDANEATDNDDETITRTDVKPAITVTKTGDPTTVLETGGSVVFTYVVANTGTVPVTLTSLVDDKFGALAGDADCTIGDAEADPVVPATVLAAGASCSFQATFAIPAGAAGTTHEDVFTAKAVDDDANEATDNDDETITRTDVKPDISVTKVASPLSLAEPGGEFTFTYVVTNDGTVPVTLNSVTDSVIGSITLPEDVYLLPDESTLAMTGKYTYTDDGVYPNTVTAIAADADGNTDTATATAEVTVTDVPPTIDLLKSVTPNTRPEPGGVFNYTLTIHNTSAEAVTIKSLSDTNLLSLECEALINVTIAAGGTASCSYTVTQADAGTYPNTASATVQDNDGSGASASDSETVTVTNVDPAISVTKAASEQQVFAPGENVEFTVVVTNNSVATDPVTITGLVDSIHGDLNGQGTCVVPQTIQPGKSYTCKFTALVDGDETDRVDASGVDDENTPVSAYAEATVGKINPSLTIVKTTNGDDGQTFLVGTPLTWSYLVTNNGDVPLANITVTDDKLGAICTIETLAAGASTTCTATGTAVPGQYTNIGAAAATYTDLDGDVKPLLSSDPSSYYGAAPALLLVKTATPTTYRAVGDVIAYSYLLTNSGNVTLSGPFTVTDDKAIDEACPATPTSLAPGESVTCTASYTISQADLDAGSVTNVAAGHGFWGTTPVDSNTDSETVTATQSPALSLVKTATPTTYSAVDQVISYSYLLTNTGNVTLSGPFSVTDDKATDEACPATPVSLAPGASVTCTASYTITQADLDAGSVTNIAAGHGFWGTTPVNSDPDSETVIAVPTKSLSLVKTADPLTYNAKDQTITYSYVIKNTGNVTLSGPFAVTDDKAPVTCTQPTDAALSPNEEMTCTATYTITQADLDNGSVTNKATASGGGATSNEAQATITAVPTKALSLVKTADPLTYNAVDQTITYSYVIKNTGNVTLSGPFAVTDDKAPVTCTQPPTLRSRRTRR